MIALAVWSAGCDGVPPPDSADARPVTATTRETHLVFFPILTGSHANVDCNDCHGKFDTFRKFECTDCHTQADTTPRHTSVSGFKWVSAECYACHMNGTNDGDHSRFFPTAAGDTHAGIGCTSCHVDPQNRDNVDCSSCHAQVKMDPVHGAVGGYQFAGRACIRCHAESQVSPVASHLPFNIGSGARHYLKSCLSCHPGFRGDKTFAANFDLSAATCGPCHSKSDMDSVHAGKSGYAYVAATCVQSGCHPNGRRP